MFLKSYINLCMTHGITIILWETKLQCMHSNTAFQTGYQIVMRFAKYHTHQFTIIIDNS